MNILYIDEELNLEYNIYKINIKISTDYNFILINCSPKSSPDEKYKYILNKNELMKIIKRPNIEENTNIKFYFDNLTKLFEDKKTINIIFL